VNLQTSWSDGYHPAGFLQLQSVLSDIACPARLFAETTVEIEAAAS